MPELHDALGDLDRPTDPRPEFAAALEERWLAALGGTAPVEVDGAEALRPEDHDLADVPSYDEIEVGARTRRDRTPRRARLALAAAAVLVVALLAAALVAGRAGRSPTTPVTTDPPTTAPATSAPPSTTKVLDSGDTLTARHRFAAPDLGFSKAPKRLTLSGSSLWVPLASTSRAVELDAQTLEAVREVETGLADVTDVAVIGDAVWFAGTGGVTRLDPGAAAAQPQAGLAADREWAVAAAGQDVWAGQFGDRRISRVDPSTGAQTDIELPQAMSLLAASPSRVWVYSESEGDVPPRVRGLDPATGAEVITADLPQAVGFEVGNLLATEDGVWLAGGGRGAWILRVGNDGTVGTKISLPGDYADGMQLDGDAIWVAVRYGANVYRVSTADGSVLDKVTVPDLTADLAVADGILFTASYSDSAVQRIRLAG